MADGQPAGGGRGWAAWPAAAVAGWLAAAPAGAQPQAAPAFAPGVEAVEPAAPSRPEDDATFGDPFDPRLRFDLPGLSFVPRDGSSAAPSRLGLDARRIAVTLAGVRVSSLLATGHDAVFFPHLAGGVVGFAVRPGADSAALRGDAPGGTIDLVPPDPPASAHRPDAFEGGARVGFAGDAGALAGHLRGGAQIGALRAAASFAGAAFGLCDGLSLDEARVGEARTGHAILDLRTELSPEDVLRLLLRLDGVRGFVRGGPSLARGFLRLENQGGTLVEGLYRHGDAGPGSVTAWAAARTSRRVLSAFDPPAGRWSRADETLWLLAGGAALAFGERWWEVDLAGELRAEGLGASLTRSFVEAPGTWSDLRGDWPYRPGEDGASRAGGAVALSAGFRATRSLDLRAALSLDVRRLRLPIDPFGQDGPERYAETEAWEAEPGADLGFVWRIGEGLRWGAWFETGARPPGVEELTAAGRDPAADVHWVPAYELDPERFYGGRLQFDLDLGVVRLGAAYHVRWIDGALAAGPLSEPAPGRTLDATWRNTEEFVQGGAVWGTVFLHRDWPVRFLLESTHGWRADGWSGDHEPPELAPLSVLVEAAYRAAEGGFEAGVYGGYRWRPDSWTASAVEERLAAACSMGEVRCAARERSPLGFYLRWSFWETLGLVVRAGGLTFQDDGPTLQGFLVGSL